MRMFVGLTLAMLAHTAGAQSQTVTANPVGVWRGTSTCLVRPSSCNDEVVVYRITRATSSDSVAFDGRKVVNGQEVEMGVLGCRVTAQGAQISCNIPTGVWRFTIRGDSLIGELRQANNTKFRDVRTARSR